MFHGGKLTLVASLGIVIAMLAVVPALRSAPPELRLEKQLPPPAIGAEQYLGSRAWVGFDPTGRHLAAAYLLCGGKDFMEPARLTVWETSEYRVVRDAEMHHMNWGNDLGLRAAFHPSGSHVLEFSHLALKGKPIGAAKNEIDIKTVARGTTLDIVRRKGTFWVGECGIKQIVVDGDNTLFIDSVDPEEMKSFVAEKKYALEGQPALLAMDSALTKIVWAQGPAKNEGPEVVRVLDLTSGKSLELKSAFPIEHIRCLAFSQDGKQAASGSADGVVRLWGVKDGKEKFYVSLNPFTTGSAAFSPDGRVIAFGGFGTGKEANLFLVDAETGKTVWYGSVDKRGVIGVAFSPKGDKLAVLGGSAKGLYVYDVKENRKSIGKN